MIQSGPLSPPAFNWDIWYASVGGRQIHVEEVDAVLTQIREAQYPRFNGPVNPDRHHFNSAIEARDHIKQKAKEFGADEAGVAMIEPDDIYTGRTVAEPFAVVVGQRMRWRAFQQVPSHEGAIECMRIYFTLGEVVITLAEYIRSIGYNCSVEHPIGDSNILHIPLALKAGFGELGRHGSIIHPTMGPLFRLGSVITDIPMAIDKPIDAGIAKFCDHCKACRIYCPANAIPDQRNAAAGKDHLGNDRYQVDTGKCFPYFATNHYCSACLPVCVYNHKEWAQDFDGFQTKLFPEVIMHPSPMIVDPIKAHDYNKLKR